MNANKICHLRVDFGSHQKLESYFQTNDFKKAPTSVQICRILTATYLVVIELPRSGIFVRLLVQSLRNVMIQHHPLAQCSLRVKRYLNLSK